PMLSADGTSVAALAGGPKEPLSVVRVDVGTSRLEVLRAELDDTLDEAYLPVPRHVEVEGKYGRVVHALVYPPTNPDAEGPQSERPPYLVGGSGCRGPGP